MNDSESYWTGTNTQSHTGHERTHRVILERNEHTESYWTGTIHTESYWTGTNTQSHTGQERFTAMTRVSTRLGFSVRVICDSSPEGERGVGCYSGPSGVKS